MERFAIHSNHAVFEEAVREATILIENGKISGVLDGYPNNLNSEIIDVQDSVLMPGLVDPHVHINEPGRTEWEGFETATKAAIAGGITTLVEMPLNASPVTTTLAAFEAKLAATKNKLHTNCGFWGGIVPGNTDQIEPLAERGVLGFKAFLTHSGIDEFPNVTKADLDKAMPIIAKLGLPLLVHCELSEVPSNSMNDHPQSYRQYLASRPASWEDDAIELVINLCKRHQCKVHIVHLSSANAIEKVKEAKKTGLPLTAETAQHYLYFNAETIPDGNTAFKCAPPIREKRNNDQLWKALESGIIDFVATDHSPAPPAMKELESGDFMKAWGGIASLQFALPVLWTAARNKMAGLGELSKWLCTHPAALAGLQDQKGKIAKGFDADLVIWDPGQSFVVTQSMILHKHKITPYLGEALYGVVQQTFLAGEKVFDRNGFTRLNEGRLITHSVKSSSS